MKILVKFPTRQRPIRFFEALDQYIQMAEDLTQLKFLITVDTDDSTMNNSDIISKLESYKNQVELVYYFGSSKTKIEAINADMSKAENWDIVLLASDDMIPVVKGYDRVIRNDMKVNFPDTDGTLWYRDGGQDRINTLSILGKKYYERFGYLYHPRYISFYCDNEFTDVSVILKKVYRSSNTIIEHQHYTFNKSNQDSLYVKNDGYMGIDGQVYLERGRFNFDLNKKKIISFCVYGTNPMYKIGAIKNAELAQNLYPGWICRYYLFLECWDLKAELEKFSNVELILIDKQGGDYSTLYRFLPLCEKDVLCFISRDTDSRLSVREKAAVNEWVVSNKQYHIMKDHPLHYTEEYPILAGMWGAKGNLIANIKELIDTYIEQNKNAHAKDQHFLKFVYDKLVKQNNIIHTENTFPLARNYERDKVWFVGQPINEHEQFHGPWQMFLEQLGISEK